MKFFITIVYCVFVLPLSAPREIVHPCDEPNKGGCEQECKKVGYARLCSCFYGFRLSQDGQSCEEHPCTLPDKGGCAQICNIEGLDYSCECNSGYSLSFDEQSCERDKGEPTEWDAAINTGMINGIYDVADDVTDEEDTADEEDSNETLNVYHEERAHPCDRADKGDCEQICVKEGYQYSCACESGYKLADDGKSCENPNDNLNAWESPATYGVSDQEFVIEVKNAAADVTKKDSVEEKNKHSNEHAEQPLDENEEHPCDLPDKGDCEQICVKEGRHYSCQCEQGFNMMDDGKSCEDPNAEPVEWQPANDVPGEPGTWQAQDDDSEEQGVWRAEDDKSFLDNF